MYIWCQYRWSYSWHNRYTNRETKFFAKSLQFIFDYFGENRGWFKQFKKKFHAHIYILLTLTSLARFYICLVQNMYNGLHARAGWVRSHGYYRRTFYKTTFLCSRDPKVVFPTKSQNWVFVRSLLYFLYSSSLTAFTIYIDFSKMF